MSKESTITDYLKELLSHQQERRKEKGSTVFLQAPDVKNGVGGLRDFQGVLWMAKVKFNKNDFLVLLKENTSSKQEAKSMEDAYSFSPLRVRNELHFRSKRPVDILHLKNNLRSPLGLVTRRKIFSVESNFLWRITIQKPEFIKLVVYLKKD